MAQEQPRKICVVCGEDCSDRPRTKDPKGRYFCNACYELAKQRWRDKRAQAGQGAAPPLPAPVQAATCPGCDRPLPPNARICVGCGVNVETGRSLVMSRGLDEGQVYGNAERILRLVSWITPIGVFPIASEAMGSRRPYAVWAITVLTVIVSVWFWLSTDSQMDSRKNLMLWGGNAPPSAELIMAYYEWTDWGDARALHAKIGELESGQAGGPAVGRDLEAVIVAAHSALTPAQQAVGRFHWYQLLTHALLHGDIFHIAGNLLFLLIFGSRVNALVGNIGTAILYPILAAAAAFVQMASTAAAEPQPMLGASGAIMGLAGMYVVLFPVNRMHMAAWLRWWFYFRLKLWALRGFWVVLFYMAFDVLYVSLGAETGVAHWAHLGGFIAGVVIALSLLLGRLLNAGGGDVISVVMGRHAWKVIGRPGEKDRLGLRLPEI